MWKHCGNRSLLRHYELISLSRNKEERYNDSMSSLTLFFVSLFGTIIGSFCNVVLFRKNTGETVVFGRSRCLSCGKTIAWQDNIPLISFLLLRGRCRWCHSKISWQYPLVEFLVGLLAVLLALKFSIFYFFAFVSLFLVAAYDARTKIIDSHLLNIFAVFALGSVLYRWYLLGFLITDFISAGAIAFFFWAMWRVSDGTWMGEGDSRVAFWCALFVGHPLSVVMFLLSFWIGGIVGAFLLLARAVGNHRFFSIIPRITLKSEIPFAPFLAFATFLVWYQSEFFNVAFHVVFG